ANQLLVSVQVGSLASAGRGQGLEVQRASSAPASTALVSAQAGNSSAILADELSEEELEQIFAERRATIERNFEALASGTEEPASFMRQPEDSTTKEKLSHLMRQMRQQQQEEESGGTSSPGQASPTKRPPASSLFLTGIGEDQVDLRPTRSRASDKAAAGLSSVPEVSSAGGYGNTPSMPIPLVETAVDPPTPAGPAAAFAAVLAAGGSPVSGAPAFGGAGTAVQ
ncbi:unnamed protein product, partial [Polarella glacialis]